MLVQPSVEPPYRRLLLRQDAQAGDLEGVLLRDGRVRTVHDIADDIGEERELHVGAVDVLGAVLVGDEKVVGTCLLYTSDAADE